MNDPARIPGQVGLEDAKMGMQFILVFKQDLRLEHHPTNRTGYAEGIFASNPIKDMHGKTHIMVEGGGATMLGLRDLNRLLNGWGSGTVLIKRTESGIKELFEHACATGMLTAAEQLVSNFPDWCSAEALARAEVESDLRSADAEYERLQAIREQTVDALMRVNTLRDDLRTKLSSM